jgi:hypothetical protein
LYHPDISGRRFIITKMKKIFLDIKDFFSDNEDPIEPRYDPVHMGAMIVLVLFINTLLFWLLWSILVFGGGLQAKVIPALQLIFTSKTAADFGYVAYPFEMGVFEGWITNVIAFILFIAAIVSAWYVFNNDKIRAKQQGASSKEIKVSP